MGDDIDIKGLDKIEVFRRLYNASKPQGMGYLHFVAADMDRPQAFREYGDGVFDYHRGRVMKVDLRGDKLDPLGYDRDNGAGAARAALGDLLEQQS